MRHAPTVDVANAVLQHTSGNIVYVSDWNLGLRFGEENHMMY